MGRDPRLPSRPGSLALAFGWELLEQAAKNNWLVDSIRSTTALKKLNVPDGVYICVCYTSFRRGHCFALEVVSSQYLVNDDGVYRMDLDAFAGHCIKGFISLRRVEQYTPCIIHHTTFK